MSLFFYSREGLPYQNTKSETVFAGKPLGISECPMDCNGPHVVTSSTIS